MSILLKQASSLCELPVFRDLPASFGVDFGGDSVDLHLADRQSIGRSLAGHDGRSIAVPVEFYG